VFSPTFLRCLNNHRSSDATSLHAAAKRCLQRIAAVRAAAPENSDSHLQSAISAALSHHTGFGAAVAGKAQVLAAIRYANTAVCALCASLSHHPDAIC
jgi:hypothetical protein